MQIAGLSAATVVTLVLVPVLYAICVLDLKLVRWGGPRHSATAPQPRPPLGGKANGAGAAGAAA